MSKLAEYGKISRVLPERIWEEASLVQYALSSSGREIRVRRVNVLSIGRLIISEMVTCTELACDVDMPKDYGVMHGAPGRRALVSQAIQIQKL